ncbi:ABC transporter ATP-binding protein [Acidaminococcus sp. CAG:542]|uniref:ABC transporter ATP-binding protein n=1 Tax=Acidaminococcus sp. CAG:542 TaxID=1262687 RepID=UPI000340849B|nr:ABC transporter ATP-binding protein [Acidaminococcus sp. CAG:542]CDE94837.1 aBC transporter related protein [Acidaminococcus sp. CAG:542]
MEFAMEKGSLGYGREPVLTGLDFTLEAGECVGLIGPNGAGKSTLLKALAGILPLQSGTLELEGKPLESWNRQALSRKVSYLPQERELPFAYTAEQVVLMGRYPYLDWHQQEGGRERALARDCLEVFGLGNMQERPVTDLSGGQRQRVLLSRILIQQTPVILLDEPTAELDLVYENTVLELSRHLARAGRTVVLSLHDIGQAARYCTRLLLLGQRKLLAQGTPEQVLRKENLEAAYQVPFQVRQGEEGLEIRICPDPEQQKRELARLNTILENREA